MESEKVNVVDANYQVDSILDEIGNFGKFQIKNYIWITLSIVLNAWYGLSFVFTGGSTDHRCMISECEDSNNIFNPPWLNHTIPSDNGVFASCTRYVGINDTYALPNFFEGNDTCPSGLFNRNHTVNCDKRIYENYETIIGEFDIGCHEWMRTLIGTVNNIGQLFAMPLTGFVSDKYGRKSALILGLITSGVVGIIRSFSQSYWMFLSFELIDPMLGSGVYSTAFILGVELVGPKYRILGSTIICGFYAIGEVLLGMIAYLVPYWRTLLIALYVPGVFAFLYIWLIPESVRWLINKGRTKEAGDILKKAAEVNGVVLSNKSLELIENTVPSSIGENNENKISIKSVLKSRIIVVRVLVCSFWWITCTFVFYGLSLNSVDLAGDKYLNFILVSLIEIPGYIVYYFTVDRFGRKVTLSASFLGSGIACLAFAFIPDIFWLKLTLYLLGKFCITLSFSIVYIYTTELFPTPLRHSLLATCSMFGRIGSIIAPQTPLLSTVYEPLPLLLFGGTSMISGFTIFLFPETINIKLPDTIEEAENISKSKQNDKI